MFEGFRVELMRKVRVRVLVRFRAAALVLVQDQAPGLLREWVLDLVLALGLDQGLMLMLVLGRVTGLVLDLAQELELVVACRLLAKLQPSP